MSFIALLCSLRPTLVNQGSLRDGTLEREEDLLEMQATRALFEPHIHPLCESPCGGEGFTFAFIHNERHYPTLRVTALDEAGISSIPHLLHTLMQHPPFHLGDRWYTCDSTDLSHSTWAGLSTWADFLAPPYGHTIRLHLGTPLILMKMKLAARETAHFPSPRPLFTTLAHRWHMLGGPPLPADIEPLLDNGSIVLADYRLQAKRITLDEQDHLGFLGWISYECRTKSTVAQVALTALARFAFFAGIGEFTQFGMGTTRVSIGA